MSKCNECKNCTFLSVSGQAACLDDHWDQEEMELSDDEVAELVSSERFCTEYIEVKG